MPRIDPIYLGQLEYGQNTPSKNGAKRTIGFQLQINMSINNRLITFAQQKLVLSHDETERNKIIASLEHFEKKLKDNFGNNIREFIRFGSFTRNTILPREFDPESDVDLMVVFRTDMGVSSPGFYRKQLHDFVERVYPNSISKKDFPVVKLSLNHIHFDIVPAYVKVDWFGNRYYYIPGKNDSWIETNPNDLNKHLESLNSTVGKNSIRNAIRLCKYWNANNGYPFESYLMEKRILDFWYGSEDTYSCFIKILTNLKEDFPKVIPILNEIALAKGGFFTDENIEKQWAGVKKLLPAI